MQNRIHQKSTKQHRGGALRLCKILFIDKCLWIKRLICKIVKNDAKENHEPVHCPIESQRRWRFVGCRSCCHRRHTRSWTCFWGTLPPFKIDAFFAGFQFKPKPFIGRRKKRKKGEEALTRIKIICCALLL